MYETRWASWDAAVVTPARRNELMEEPFELESLLVDPRSGQTVRLNETATRVWRLCDGRTTTRAIAEQLTSQYDVSLDDALDCVDQLVLRFADAHLLELRTGA